MVKKIYYFAYGSNLSFKQMLKRCPHSTFVAKANLANHQLAFTGYSSRWGGGVATIIKQPGSTVWGVVYALDKDCLTKLDGFEGLRYKVYKRKNAVCRFTNGKKRSVHVYIREPRRWSHSNRKYLRTIIDGAENFELPPSYIKSLKDLPAT